MKRFKLHQGDLNDFPIDRKTYKDKTQERKPYVQRFPTQKNGYALCPYCDNPIVIIGLYRQVEGKPADYMYGKHYNGSVPGIGDHNEVTYLNCKYAVKAYNVCPKEQIKDQITDYERRIYRFMHDYYDKVIYVLQESIGYKIPTKMAEVMIQDYVYSQGYMYPPHTIDNSPWMLMCLSGYSIEPFRQRIKKDSPLFNILSKIKTVNFENIYISALASEYQKREADKYQLLVTSKYTEISILFRDYKRIKRDNEMIEIITMTVSYRFNDQDMWELAGAVDIEIDDSYLQNILNSKKAMQYRNTSILKIADDNMPKLI